MLVPVNASAPSFHAPRVGRVVITIPAIVRWLIASVAKPVHQCATQPSGRKAPHIRSCPGGPTTKNRYKLHVRRSTSTLGGPSSRPTGVWRSKHGPDYVWHDRDPRKGVLRPLLLEH